MATQRFRRRDPAIMQKQITELKGGSSFKEDPTEWKLKTDQAKNGTAVIRFLPPRDEDSLPFVRLVTHGIKLKNKWFIHNCPSTHGDYDGCPACEYLKEHDLFNTDKSAYQNFKRKTSYWANILVITDKANPANEGKVFKYRFGQKIMDKIQAMIEVDVEVGEIPVDVTCPYEGADFILKCKEVSGFQNYDDSKFRAPSEIPNIDDEAYQEKLFSEMPNIMEIVAEDKFESKEKLDKSFKELLGSASLGKGAKDAEQQADSLQNELDNFQDDDLESELDSVMNVETPKPKQEKPTQTSNTDDDIDDLLDGLD